MAIVTLSNFDLHEFALSGQWRCTVEELQEAVVRAIKELDQANVQLAGCGVAALGWSKDDPAKPGDYGYSASYGNVLALRKKFELLTARVEALVECCHIGQSAAVGDRCVDCGSVVVFDKSLGISHWDAPNMIKAVGPI